MPFVVKTNSVAGEPIEPHAAVKFEVTTYQDAFPEVGDSIAWFTSEVNGGVGLHALGTVVSGALEHGRAPNGRRLVTFKAAFDKFDPQHRLGKDDFAALDRSASATAEERIGQVLYWDSLTKVAVIDQDAFNSLISRFN